MSEGRLCVWTLVAPLSGALWVMSGCGGSSGGSDDGSTSTPTPATTAQTGVYDVYLVGDRVLTTLSEKGSASRLEVVAR